MKIHFWHN
jgi:hypothetical protein